MLLNACNYNYFDNYMVTRLYKLEKQDADKHDFQSFWQRSSFALPNWYYNLKEFVRDLVPEKLRCCAFCKQDRKERYFELARERLMKEVNIMEIIKSRRYFTRAFKALLTPQ